MQIKNRQQFLTILTLAAVGLLALDRVIVPPLSAFYKNRSARIVELKSKLKDGQQLIRREQILRGRWAEMQTNALPADTSVAEQKLLASFDQWSQRSGASINSLMPQWKQDSDDYETLECRVDASGDLSNLAHFIYDIERDPLALKVQSVELASRDPQGRQLTLGIQVSGLVLNPDAKLK